MSSVEDLNYIAQQVEKMLQNPIEPKYVPHSLRVSGKVVKQISTGIYRSPGNSIKELVSNAFDADALNVYVLTGKPSFDSFRIYDDGDGMSANEFTSTMQRIGASVKMPGEHTKKGRPVIGRIGIGLLAVGNISKRFDVISGKEGETAGFEAKVDLTQMFEVETDARPLEDLTAGTIKLRTYHKPSEQHYTSIIVNNAQGAWKNQLCANFPSSYSNFLWSNPRIASGAGGDEFKKFVQNIQDGQQSISKLAGYDQLLWEVGLLSPVRYFNDGPVIGAKCDVIEELKDGLISYNFNLFVDGIEVRKPILFPLKNDNLELGSGFDVYPVRIEKKTPDAMVKAKGYIYHQSVRILPAELRGFLPRIRNVGIGLPIENRFRLLTESPVLTYQIFGEVYVEDGLDAALNIDRSSFFEADPAFVLLRSSLEEALKENIMASIRRRLDDWRTSRKTENVQSIHSLLINIASKAGLQKPRIVYENTYNPKFLELDTETKTIKIYARRIPKSHQKILLGAVLCYQLSKSAPNPEETFYRLLNEFIERL